MRLAELVAALSLGVDLGFGQPMEHVLRQCLIALRLGERVGLDEDERAVVYYTALLVNVGCHTDAHEQAKWFGDDIAFKSAKYDYELDLREEVLDALAAAYETWDGRGWPGSRAGDEIPVASRIAQIAEFVEVAHRVGGVEAATALARARSGTQFDPSLAELVAREGEMLLMGLETVGAWDAVIDAEPALAVLLTGEQIDRALLAIANFVDLKSPYTLGHAAAVAQLAAAAGGVLGVGADEQETLRRAGLVHDLGRLGVSNAIWDKAGPLGAGEWERVRLHPYLTERMLRFSDLLAPLGAIAVQHRERLDGSGYPNRLASGAISRPARILGAADAYQAMREPRPYRPAGDPNEAAAELRREVKAGKLDADAVEAVLGAAGHRVARRREGPAGLTPREIEVLRLLARGLSNKQIAAKLVIASKTVGNHIEHIYAKTGASNRAGAGLFAMQHGLLPEEETLVAGAER
jgi:HD-GYP domain-containing protein (c-di-GMP phosphodiesterase class II)